MARFSMEQLPQEQLEQVRCPLITFLCQAKLFRNPFESRRVPLYLCNGRSFASSMSSGNVERIELLQGTLDLLIVRTLLLRPRHGNAIANCIKYSSADVLEVGNGSLYPALHRLIRRGWIVAEEGRSENNRRAKFY